jgi:hypothetical protein
MAPWKTRDDRSGGARDDRVGGGVVEDVGAAGVAFGAGSFGVRGQTWYTLAAPDG